MHICFVTFGNFKGHSTLKRATGMAGPLQQLGHKVTLLLENSLDNIEKVKLECPDTAVIWHKRAKWFGPERAEKQRAIQQLNPDVVWICGVGFRNWITHKGHQAVIIADHSELYSAVESAYFKRQIYRIIEQLYLYAFDGHICASKYLFNHYSQSLQPRGQGNRVHHSPYAYHESDLEPLPQQTPKDKKIILYLGSFWKNYGFWDMLYAIQLVTQKRSDIKAILIGRGPEAQSGREWIQNNELTDYIQFPGYVDDHDLGTYLSQADVFLSPMRDTVQDWARCPSKQYLYLPFRKPIVTAKIGESAAVFGDNGCYYEPQNVHSMAEAIIKALDHPEKYPPPDPQKHTFKARAKLFIDWYTSSFHQNPIV